MLLGSCQTPKKKVSLRQTFKMPIYDIAYTPKADSATLLQMDSIMPYYPKVMRTKYSFQDTILRLKISYLSNLMK